jgi:S1 RNA binding domain protein
LENETPDNPTEAPGGAGLSPHGGTNHEQDAHAPSVKKGDIVDVTVKRIAPFGAFVRLADGSKGLVHISQIDDSYVTEIREHLKIGDSIKAKVLAIGEDGRIDLSIKKAKRKPVAKKNKPRQSPKPRPGSGFKITPFEEAFDKKLNVTLES